MDIPLTKMLARRAPQLARRALANSQRRRTFVGGAFESDFQEARAKVRRRRIGSFLSALDQLPSSAAAVQEETQLLVRSTLSEHAPSGRFDSQQQLVAAIEATRARLEDSQTDPLKLELKAETELKALGLPNESKPEGGVSAQPAAGGHVDPSSNPIQQSSAAAAYAAATPQAPPPAADDDPPIPDVLTAEQRATLVSLRASIALDALPSMWEQLPRATFLDPFDFPPQQDPAIRRSGDPVPTDAAAAGGGDDAAAASANAASSALPLPVVLDAADALVALDPWARMRFHMAIANGSAALSPAATSPSPSAAPSAGAADAVGGDGAGGEARASPSWEDEPATAATEPPARVASDEGVVVEAEDPRAFAEQLRAAAVATAEGAYPLTLELLTRSELLSKEEIARLGELSTKGGVGAAATTVTGEVRRRTIMRRAGHAIAPAGKPERPTDRAMAAADRRDAALYAAMQSDADLHMSLSTAVFSHHDRLSTRKRRRWNAVKYTFLFMALNCLDFFITNI